MPSAENMWAETAAARGEGGGGALSLPCSCPTSSPKLLLFLRLGEAGGGAATRGRTGEAVVLRGRGGGPMGEMV